MSGAGRRLARQQARPAGYVEDKGNLFLVRPWGNEIAFTSNAGNDGTSVVTRREAINLAAYIAILTDGADEIAALVKAINPQN